MRLSTTAAAACFLLALTTPSFGSDTAQDILKSLQDFQTKASGRIDSSLPTDKAMQAYAKIEADLKTKAIAKLSRIDVNTVDPKDGYAWAQIAVFAGDHKAVGALVDRFLTSNPLPEDAFPAQLAALNSSSTLGDAESIVKRMAVTKPANGEQYNEFVMYTVYVFSETVMTKLGADAALKLMDDLAVKPLYSDPQAAAKKRFAEYRGYYPAGKPPYPTDADLMNFLVKMTDRQNKELLASIVSRKAEILSQSGRNKEATSLIDSFIKENKLVDSAKKMLEKSRMQASLFGTQAPDFSAPAWGGGEFKLSSLKGKIVILDFWATWCGPCMESLPHIQKIHEATKDKGVQVVALNVWDTKKEYSAWVPANHSKYTFQFAFDPAGQGPKSIATKHFGVSGIPTTIVIDKDGKVVAVLVGYMGAEDHRIEDALAKLGVSVEK